MLYIGMAKTKYKEYVERMLTLHKEEFEKFREVHDNYALNEDIHQEEFNAAGAKIMPLIRQWENKLCMQSEKGGYGSYTTRLAEKFQEEVRKHFPKIDNVGLIVEKTSPFSIRKINLHS